jgi:traG family protein
VRPFLSIKYDLTKHPNYKYTDGANKKNTFDIEKFLKHELNQYEVVDVDGEKK